MKFKTLSDFKLAGKRILLRVDLNTEVINGKVIPSPRFKAHLQTINELKRKKAKIVILAHQSRPGEKDFISLKKHAKILKVKFVPDVIGEEAISAIQKLKSGEVLLLENIRFLKEEFQGDEKNILIKTLAPLFDLYVNDAFSVSHRNQTSITGFPKVLPSAIGRIMESELKNLEKLKIKNCLFILGGKKIEENLMLLTKRKILSAGTLGQLLLISRGVNFGLQNKLLKNELKYIRELKKFTKIIAPLDYAFLINGKRKEFSLDELPVNYEIMDIGKKTMNLYINEIKKAKAIFMKGPVGYCEEKYFCEGTKAILEAIANSKAFSVLAGGHLSTTVEKLKINKNKFGYISLSGGALVEYLAGKKLPGLEALKDKRK